MENKQKAIQEAYSKLMCENDYLYIIQYVNLDNGFTERTHYHWLKNNFTKEFIKENFQVTVEIDNDKIFRPKSLQGIETNNGWIKIESEDDLPKELIFYNACNKNEDFEEVPMFYGLNLSKLEKYYKSEIITHYQPIFKPKPPIY